jgi:hypothetical protein
MENLDRLKLNSYFFYTLEQMMTTGSIPWDHPFPPTASEMWRILGLTITQTGITVIPSSVILLLSISGLQSKEGTESARACFFIALCASISSLTLIVFAIFIFVSKWVSIVMDRSNPDVGNVSYDQLYEIMKPSLSKMFAVGLFCTLLSLGAVIIAGFELMDGWFSLWILLPILAMIWSLSEFVKAEISI